MSPQMASKSYKLTFLGPTCPPSVSTSPHGCQNEQKMLPNGPPSIINIDILDPNPGRISASLYAPKSTTLQFKKIYKKMFFFIYFSSMIFSYIFPNVFPRKPSISIQKHHVFTPSIALKVATQRIRHDQPPFPCHIMQPHHETRQITMFSHNIRHFLPGVMFYRCFWRIQENIFYRCF